MNDSADNDIEMDDTIDEFIQFEQMRIRSFILRTDNEKDQFCTFKTSLGTEYVKLSKILKSISTEEIHLIGHKFQVLGNCFSIPCDSCNTGMVFGKELSKRSFRYSFTELENKCFAFPCSAAKDKWAISNYLH